MEEMTTQTEKPLPAEPAGPGLSNLGYGIDDGRDVESGVAQGRKRSQSGQSRFTQAYGASMEDTPARPPRHAKSQSSLRSHRSRSSLPGTYNTSQRPMTGDSQNQGESTAPSVAEELSWGPSHPCFPHLNPHVPLNSPEYETTRVIRIRRDWMIKGDLAPTFSNLYPEILDPLIPEDQFRTIVGKINTVLSQAFDPYSRRNWIDSVLGLMTGWLWDDLGAGGLKRQLTNLEAWLEQWNREVGVRENVKIIPLRRTGYMTLDIQIPDPQVRVIGEDDPELK